MTEDGRSFGVAAPCGPSLSPFRACGQSDAQSDANTNSLSLVQPIAERGQVRIQTHASSFAFEGESQ